MPSRLQLLPPPSSEIDEPITQANLKQNTITLMLKKAGRWKEGRQRLQPGSPGNSRFDWLVINTRSGESI